jgi:hypothetical protein
MHLLLSLANKSVALGLDALLSSLTESLVLGTLSIHLLLEQTLTLSLSLGLLDVFNQTTLVLEGVTLGEVVKLVVEVLVDLAGGTVADEETTENTHAAHPEEGAGHTGLLGTLALTQTAVTADPAGLGELTGAGARVHGDGLADDEAILDELADGLAGVGVGDFAHLIGVEPNLALAAADHGGREALLGAKVDPIERRTHEVSMRPRSELSSPCSFFLASSWVVMVGKDAETLAPVRTVQGWAEHGQNVHHEIVFPP